jgi:hypothetical protein
MQIAYNKYLKTLGLNGFSGNAVAGRLACLELFSSIQKRKIRESLSPGFTPLSDAGRAS